jgi:K+-transporting ATPase KdpF subunit
MTLTYLIVGGLAVLLFVYLLIALFFPERFQ